MLDIAGDVPTACLVALVLALVGRSHWEGQKVQCKASYLQQSYYNAASALTLSLLQVSKLGSATRGSVDLQYVSLVC